MKQAPAFWEKLNPISLLLWPLSILFLWIANLRRFAYNKGLLQSQKLPVPVIIVGNIRVGGTGKTPIVIALAKELSKLGLRPGIISRGYVQNSSASPGRQAQTNSNSLHDGLEVLGNASPAIFGDEPVLMAKQLSALHIPVFIGKKRYATGIALLKKHPSCDVIISDDGLQHYALARNPARAGGTISRLLYATPGVKAIRFYYPQGLFVNPKIDQETSHFKQV